MKQKFLAAKIALIVALTAGAFTTSSVQAVMPVIDGSNLAQNTVSAAQAVKQSIQQVEQYKTQLEQYQTQLEQYENMLQNTKPPAAYIWDQAQTTMNRLVTAQDTLNYYESQFGSLDSYLEKFQDVAYYRSSPCFNGLSGCTPDEKAAMEENRRLANESQKKANDALFRSLKKQQDALTADARTLKQLQVKAQGATGQLAAVQYANQFASQQANQLLQIRAMLLAQQNAVATRMQAIADKEAQQQAAAEYLLKGSFVPSPDRSW